MSELWTRPVQLGEVSVFLMILGVLLTWVWLDYARLRNDLKMTDAYVERNIKRIDGELEMLNADVNELSDTTMDHHRELERIKTGRVKRWMRSMVWGWVG